MLPEFSGTMSREPTPGSAPSELNESSDLLLKNKIRKLKYVISQMLLVNRHLKDEEIRYQRAAPVSCSHRHSYNGRLRMCVYHGAELCITNALTDLIRKYDTLLTIDRTPIIDLSIS